MEFKKNEHYELDITAITSKGEGIGDIDGFKVFVPNTCVGDRAEVRLLKVKKNYAYAKVINLISVSKDRCPAPCQYFNSCGGCNLQHINYEKQLDIKTDKVRDCLERIGGFKNIAVDRCMGMENPYNYRNKSQIPVGNRKGEIITGFYSPNSHNIIKMGDCLISHKINSQITEIIKNFMLEKNISAYDELSHTGLIRHIVIRTGFKTGEIMVTLVINGEFLPESEKFVEGLLKIKNIKSINLNINKEKTNVIMGKKTINLWGEEYIYDYIDNLKFKISPLSFFQVNPIQTELLYKTALEYAGLKGEETVFDAYCGIGTISLFLSQKAKQVYGVEIVDDAIKDAKQNAKLNNITNATFLTGKAEEIFPDLYHNQNIKAETVVVDPPRKGCDVAFLNMLLDMQPNKIVYISCDPATLARDLKILSQTYTPVKITPVDMFPHTSHVETVVLLLRVDE